MSDGELVYQPQNVGLFGEVHVDYAAAVKSYSSDSIGTSGAVRKPFEMDGELWVSIGQSGRGYAPYRCTSIRIYKLVAASAFAGRTVSYGERVAECHAADAAEDDSGDRIRELFYHGMKVKHAGRACVLVGPEYELLAEPVVIDDRYGDAEEEPDYSTDDWELEPDGEGEDEGEDWPSQDTLFEAQRRRESSAICALCGHQERCHFSLDERGCHWSEGNGPLYRDCDCGGFVDLHAVSQGEEGTRAAVACDPRQITLF